MMRGEKSMALAVRDSEGVIRVESRRIKPMKSMGFWYNFPVIRGVTRFVGNMVDGVRTLTRSADVFGEAEPSKFEKWLSKTFKVDLMSVVTFLAMLLGIGFALVLYSIIPNAIAQWIDNLVARGNGTGLSNTAMQFIMAGSKLVIMIAYLLLCSCIKDVRRTFQYHGAEHKTINCYEHEMDMTVENVMKCKTFHNRCGTTFLFFTILVSIIVSFFLPMFNGKDMYGILIENSALSLLARIGVRLLALPIVAGISYEFLKLMAMTDFWLLMPLKWPGMLMQKITTKEPDEKMAEVALTAFLTVMRMDADESVPELKFEMQRPYTDVVREARQRLGEDVDPADLDWILCSALKCERGKLGQREKVTPKEYHNIMAMVEERRTGKPLQYILAETNFYGYDLRLTKDVLIPRFETELLAEQAIKRAKKDSLVLDLCTGSGCIAVAVQKQTGCTVTASDVSREALAVAEQNARSNGAEIEFVESDLFEGLKGRSFDLIVSNPPYVRRADIDTLQPEVRDFEPRLALDGGEDGLDFYRTIAAQAPEYLREGGMLLLEVGEGQAQQVRVMLEDRFDVTVLKDYDRIERMIRAVLKKA